MAIHHATPQALLQKASICTDSCTHTSVKTTDGPIVTLYIHDSCGSWHTQYWSPHSGGEMEATMSQWRKDGGNNGCQRHAGKQEQLEEEEVWEGEVAFEADLESGLPSYDLRLSLKKWPRKLILTLHSKATTPIHTKKWRRSVYEWW